MAKRSTQRRKTDARRIPKGEKGKLDRDPTRGASAKSARRPARAGAQTTGRAASSANRQASGRAASTTKRAGTNATRASAGALRSATNRPMSDGGRGASIPNRPSSYGSRSETLRDRSDPAATRAASTANRAPSDGGRVPASRAASDDDHESSARSRGSTTERRRATDRGVSTDGPRVRLERARSAAIDELRRLGISGESDDHDPRGTSGAVVEEGDAAQASERRDMSFAQRERLAERINSLTEALGRIADGSYGRCEMCGNPIEPERLAALPEALRCLRCQEDLERRGSRREIA